MKEKWIYLVVVIAIGFIAFNFEQSIIEGEDASIHNENRMIRIEQDLGELEDSFQALCVSTAEDTSECFK